MKKPSLYKRVVDALQRHIDGLPTPEETKYSRETQREIETNRAWHKAQRKK